MIDMLNIRIPDPVNEKPAHTCAEAKGRIPKVQAMAVPYFSFKEYQP